MLALQAIVFLGSTPVGGPLLGYICDAMGPRAGIALGGIAAIGAAAWGVFAACRVAQPRPTHSPLHPPIHSRNVSERAATLEA